MKEKLILFFKYISRFGFIRGSRLYIKNRWGRQKKEISIQPFKNGPTLSLRKNSTDIIAFEQVFVQEEYGFDIQSVPGFIIDCGSNTGMSSVYFAQRFPQATIVSVEPEQSNFSLLQKNTSAYPQIHCLQKGIWNKNIFLEIENSHNYGHWGFRVKETHNPGSNGIAAISIHDIVQQFGVQEIGLLKMDIEGAEYEVFSSHYESWLPKTNVIMIELHDWFRKGCSKAFFSALVQYDFSVYSRGENIICIKNRA